MVKGFICRVTFNICILSAVLIGSVVSSNAASALTSQSETDFQFTFNSSITLTLSSPDLVISHITPGNYASSNTISVNVSTNNRTGYTLVAKVGDKTSSTLNNNNLVNTTGDANFTSLATTDNIALANFDDGKWGYTIAPTIASATTYSGLLYNADTIINATRNVAGDPQEGYLGSNSTSFTIGAKAGQTQASGEYTNVINFRSVANVVPDIVMQETNLSELASAMPNDGDTAMFVDNRDGSRYMVGKLADGKYWMLENLALDPATLKSGVTLDSSNTNLSAGKTFTLPNSTTTGFNNVAASYTTKAINTAFKNTSQPLAVGQSGTGKIGVYYNYCAATAGTYCFENNHTDTNNATNDICPKGWRLPTGGASGEFQALRNQYASAGEFALALRTPLSGDFYEGSERYQGNRGAFWSSTYYNASIMYSLDVYTTAVFPQDSGSRFIGFSVRCVYNPTMQEVTASNLASMMPNDGDTATLKDSRDGKSYTIGKINGQYWMTQNLDLAGGTTLTPADSNVSSNYTLPASSTSGFSNSNTAYVYNSGSTTCGDESPCYSYYSYVAATAGTSPSSGNATSDICPKGWRLPTQAEYNTLKSTYTTGATLTGSPWNGVYAGYYIESSFLGGGTDGYYWSSTGYVSYSRAYNLIFRSSSASVNYDYGRRGDSVRCVAQ